MCFYDKLLFALHNFVRRIHDFRCDSNPPCNSLDPYEHSSPSKRGSWFPLVLRIPIPLPSADGSVSPSAAITIPYRRSRPPN